MQGGSIHYREDLEEVVFSEVLVRVVLVELDRC